ncbi:MAG: FecR family protein [Bacteroidota bacterium]
MCAMRKSVDAQFIIRVLKGEVSEEEREFFEEWLEESDQHREIFASVSFLWEKTGELPAPEPPSPSEEWYGVLQGIRQRADEVDGTRPVAVGVALALGSRGGKSKPRRRAAAVHIVAWGAVALVTVATVSLFIYLGLPRLRVQDDRHDSQLAEVTTANGQRSVVWLPDGSVIYMNSGSRLRYAIKGNARVRQVWLDGEAYFSIAKDPGKPFRVVAGTSLTEAIGTEFNVRYRRGKVSVVVTEGAVQFTSVAETVRVRKGQMIKYDERSASITAVQRVSTAEAIAWRWNKLSFDRTPLDEVMEEIERTYDVKVSFGSASVKRKLLTGVFGRESLDEVLSDIAVAMDVKITRNGKEIVVR